MQPDLIITEDQILSKGSGPKRFISFIGSALSGGQTVWDKNAKTISYFLPSQFGKTNPDSDSFYYRVENPCGENAVGLITININGIILL